MAKILEEFPPVTTAAWEAAIHADLKGADYGKRLIWQTGEGVDVKPYYRSEDLQGLEYLDAIGAGRSGNGWFIAETPPDGIAVDAGRFEEAGADIVQELAFALAEGIDFFAEHRPPEMVFSFAVGSNYFFQIAKLRAFRLLWTRALEAFDAAGVKTVTHCRTSRWNKAIYDSHNNILRATTEAMSAALGGADSILVEPFDEPYRKPDAASQRLARNTQLILQQECYLDRVADPAAGSYYIESLTHSLAAEAWKLMQRVEEFGGFQKAHDSGMIPSEIAGSRAKKDDAVAQRKRIFVGVNQYPNPNERMLDKLEPHESSEIRRGTEVFEDLRLRAEQSAKTPLILLAEFGDLKMRKARSQFCAGFFGCAGFAIEARTFATAAEIAAAPADAIVLCSSDAEYAALAADLAQALSQQGRKTPLIVAGYPKDALAALRAAGVVDFVHVRSNAAETLAAWQERLGVRS